MSTNCLNGTILVIFECANEITHIIFDSGNELKGAVAGNKPGSCGFNS